MSSNKAGLPYKSLLDTIDHLRGRKARPDKTHITNHLERRFGIDKESSATLLADAVAEGEVLKVKYKDGFSYRNPHKGHRALPGKGPGLAGRSASQGSGSASVRKILASVHRLAKTQPENGVSVAQVLRDLHSRKVLLTYDGQDIDRTLRREVTLTGKLSLLSNGNFVAKHLELDSNGDQNVPHLSLSEEDAGGSDLSELELKPFKGSGAGGRRVRKKRASKSTDENGSACSSKIEKKEEAALPPLARGRPVSQRKRIKKDLGPDFLDPSDLGYQYLRDAYQPKCSYCFTTAYRKEDLLNCSKCDFKAHPKCLKKKKGLVFDKTANVWECSSCQAICFGCKAIAHNGESLISCVDCQQGYHVKCLQPIVKDRPQGPWTCSNCATSGSLQDNDEEAEDEDGEEMEEEEEEEGEEEEEEEGEKIAEVIETVDEEAHDEKEEEEEDSKGEEDEAEVDNRPMSESGDSLSDAVVNDDTVIDSGSTSKTGSVSPSVASSGEAPAPAPDPAPTLTAKGVKLEKNPNNWSIEEVVNFIRFIGFSKEADLFKDQEIDGKSLLLLKRGDVLSGLRLKLGPALKIYAHINRLQGLKCAPTGGSLLSCADSP